MKAVIIGLGRIGLPLALVAADSGINITGIDIKEDLIESLINKKTPFYEPLLDELLDKHCKINFYPKIPQEAKEDIKKASHIIFTIGTMFVKHPEKPSLERVFSLIDDILKIGIKDKTIIFRVTLPIGSIDCIKDYIENRTNLINGQDFYLAFVPERIMEGKAIEEERILPKLVGCYDDITFEKVKQFFSKIGGEIIRVSSPRTAEFIKLVDNSWRDTCFAFANELAFLAEENEINVLEAIQCANQGYKRNQIPIPGPVSGYCLGKDPYILECAFDRIVKRRGFNSVWYYGRRANDWLIDKVVEEVKGRKVLVAGLSFKENIDDFRYSHGIEIVRILIDKGYLVSVCDPYLDKNYYTKLPNDVEEKVKKFDSLESAIEDVDTIIFTIRHQEYLNLDIEKIVKNKMKSPVKVIDLWNIFRRLDDKLIIYRGLGK